MSGPDNRDFAGAFPSARDPGHIRSGLIAALVIFVAALVAYLPGTRGSEFAHDDVANYEKLEPAESIGEWLSAAGQPWWIDARAKNLWRPVARLALLAERSLLPIKSIDEVDGIIAAGGTSGVASHSASVLLHALVCVLVGALALEIGLGRAGAFGAAVVLAVHPLRSEAVMQMVGQADLFAALFMTGGLIAYVRMRRKGRSTASVLAVQAAFFALALGSKENAVVYPLLPCILEIVATGDRGALRRRVLGIAIALSLVLGAMLGARYAILGAITESAATIPEFENPLAHMGHVERVPAVLGILGYAVSRFFYPFGLSPDYSAQSLPLDAGWGWPWSLAGLAILAGLAGYAIRNWRRGGRGWALVAAGLVTYGITSNAVLTIGVSLAERLWYVPSIVLALGLGAVVGPWVEARRAASADEDASEFVASKSRSVRPGLVPGAALGVVVVFLMMGTWHYAAAWRNQMGHALWTIERFENSWRGNHNAAREFFAGRSFHRGLAYSRKAVALRPEAAESWDYLGLNATFAGGENGPNGTGEHAAEAEAAFKRAIELDADLVLAYQHMGHLLMMQGRTAEALAYLEKYIEVGDEGLEAARDKVAFLRESLRSNSQQTQQQPESAP